MHPLLSFNATYTGIMVSYGFYHKHQGWAFSFPYIRSVASSILFYVTPAAHAITGCDSTSSLFGIGKRTVFKVLKDSPENFRDLPILADCDTDKSIDAARKLVCRLYDQKGKLKEDHVDLNKLRVRLATLRDACFKQTNKIIKKQTCQ
jgi:hypothetical protein